MRRRRWAAVGMVSVALSGVCRGQAAQLAGCANTPAAAIEAMRAGKMADLQAAGLQATGFRVESVRWDAAQRQTWAVIRSCDHAERPALARLADLPHGAPVAQTGSSAALVSAQSLQANTTVAVVHAGEVVRLWRADSQAHIELMATAEENGAVGGKVRLRLLTPKEADGQYAPPRYFAGIVRGPADVEMER